MLERKIDMKFAPFPFVGTDRTKEVRHRHFHLLMLLRLIKLKKPYLNRKPIIFLSLN